MTFVVRSNIIFQLKTEPKLNFGMLKVFSLAIAIKMTYLTVKQPWISIQMKMAKKSSLGFGNTASKMDLVFWRGKRAICEFEFFANFF